MGMRHRRLGCGIKPVMTPWRRPVYDLDMALPLLSFFLTSAPKVTVNALAGPVPRRLGRYIPLVLVLFAVATAYLVGWHRVLSLETLVGNRAAIVAYIHSHA